MNTFIKTITFLCFTFLLTNCNSQKEELYTISLDECLESGDTKLLNQLTKNFEAHITSTYKTDLTEAYKRYLTEISRMQLAPDFFKNPKFREDIRLLKTSGFYEESRTTLSEVESLMKGDDMFEDIIVVTAEESLQEEYKAEETKREEWANKMTTYDPNGAYIKCLAKNCDNELVTSYINKLNDGLVIIPSLIAGVLESGLSDKDYNDNLVRVFIAMNIHYDLMIMLVEGQE